MSQLLNTNPRPFSFPPKVLKEKQELRVSKLGVITSVLEMPVILK